MCRNQFENYKKLFNSYAARQIKMLICENKKDDKNKAISYEINGI